MAETIEATANMSIRTLQEILCRLPEQRHFFATNLVIVDRPNGCAKIRKRSRIKPPLFDETFQADEQWISREGGGG